MRQSYEGAAEAVADDLRWDAMAARNASADGSFYCAVKTTGIYCRPSCKARLPRRENVMFFQHRSDAEKAGFRACKRCWPERIGS